MSYNRAEYDTEALRANFRKVRELVGNQRLICPAVKANGYGMGVLPMANILREEGADYFAVALVEEGAELRRNGYTEPILVLGAIPEKDLPKALYFDLTIGIFNFDTACLVDLIASKLKKIANIFITLDTGMHRLGFYAGERSLGEIKVISEMKNLSLNGIFSHLSQADKSREYTLKQIKLFSDFTDTLMGGGVDLKIRSLANSVAITDYPEAYFDMVRPGIILHGFSYGEKHKEDFKQILTFKSSIVRLHHLKPGDEVSYMGNYVAPDYRMIATVPIGYADGFFRCLSGKAEMLVRGKRVPQIGNICMDQCMIDVTSIPDVRIGDEVVIYGGQEDEFISVDEVAVKADTISYELLTSLKRVPKYYYFEDEDD